jgi:hypothetical protein
MSSLVEADTDNKNQYCNTAGTGQAHENRLEQYISVICAFNGELRISRGSIHGIRSMSRLYLPTQALLLDTARRKSSATH